MHVYKNKNNIVFKLNDVPILSTSLKKLENIFKLINPIIHYEKTMKDYIAMDDVNIYLNADINDYNHEIDNKIIERIIDSAYLKLCSEQLYVFDVKNKQKFYIDKETKIFELPQIQQYNLTYYEYIMNFWK